VATATREWRVRYGSDYSDVARGEWVAFPRAEGVILLAMHYGNAAATAGLKAGDTVTVRPAH
jgi:S-adenosylmethionine hydrolase